MNERKVRGGVAWRKAAGMKASEPCLGPTTGGMIGAWTDLKRLRLT